MNNKEQLELIYSNNKIYESSFHSHVHYEIFYFHSGECTYLIGDKMYSLSPGDLIIMHGLTLHRPIISDGEEYVRTIVHFDSNYFKEILDGMGMEYLLQPFTTLQSSRISLEEKDRNEFLGLLKKMNELKQTDSLSNYRCQLTFLEILAFVYSYFKKELEREKESELHSTKEHHVQRVISFIEENYMKEVHLELLEKELHVSKYYLSKVFKQVTGFTIFHYLFQRRINQAKIEFLMSPNVSVTDVSYKVGFKQPAHFSKVFKKLVSCTPESYKNSL